ncbi:transcription elongation factor-like protein B polypeptide 1 [Delitschia confertaspora ATCC 74209]|uniref:Elongin-C n=1 Tax=Delitschia confertaspora ATCC 74209 TaxID=1513339 RepID=A0A9P4JRX8_9PLEO|nr:transcription elongation factor-like protein B polypeptide 1 [Delitschia confertaspora ATCC 74209]
MATEKKASEYVTLVSEDSFEFVVRRSAAIIAGTIRRSLDPTYNFEEAQKGRVVFPTISGIILEKICEYLYYHEKHAESKDVPDMEIPSELCLELLIAADYLEV